MVEPVELIELLDRIHREGERVRYHYVIADYLCRVRGGTLHAASDADAVRWVERTEWNSYSALKLDPIAVRVIEACSASIPETDLNLLKVNRMAGVPIAG
jgi:hypothetical protein